MSTKHGVIRGAMSLSAVRIATSVLNAATLVILARLLTPQDFGVVAIAGSVLSIVLSVTQLSVAQALMQRAEATRQQIDSAWTIAFIRTGLISGFFLFGAWPLSILYRASDLIPVFIVTGLTGAVYCLANPLLSLATKDMRFGPQALYQFAHKILALLISIILAFALKSYWAILIGNLIGAATGSLLSYFLIPYRPRFTLKSSRDFLGFSSWMFFSQLCESINWRIDQLMLGMVLPTRQVGTYVMADNLAVIPSREALAPLREALFPGLATLNGNPQKLASSSMRAQSTIALIIAPFGIGLALVADPVIKVMLDEKWDGIVPYVQIFSVLYTLGSVVSLFPSAAMAVGNTQCIFRVQFRSLLFRVPAMIAGLLLGGLYGAALARLACEMFVVFLSLVQMKQLLGISIRAQIAAHEFTLKCLTAMCCTVFLARQFIDPLAFDPLLQACLLIIVGAGTYVAAAIALWMTSRKSDGPVVEIISLAGRFFPLSSNKAKVGS